MIETWIGVFLFVFIRNKFIEKYLESNEIYKYKKYNINQLFKTWQFYFPLSFVIFYIYLEYTMFIEFYYFLQYQHIIKTVTLLSYLPLVIKFKLYNNDNKKYKSKELLKIINSPLSYAVLSLWIGSFLNKIALICNNNQMPTFPSVAFWTGYIKPGGFIDGIHILGTPYSAVIPLCNIFDLWGIGVLSIGDVITRFYVVFILYYSIKRSNKTLTK